MNNTLPFRFSLLHYFGSVGRTTPHEAYEALGSSYGEKRYFSIKEIDNHFLSMCANGIAEETDVMLGEDDEIVSTYAITDYGKALLEKYYPE